MSKQLFGKINNYRGQKVYTGVSTDTADVIVNNQSNGISVNVKSKGIFDKVSATAQQLQPEQSPSVDVQQTTGGGLNFDFGIPKGDTGKGISDVYVDNSYRLNVVYTDGTIYQSSSIRGPQGDKGNGVADDYVPGKVYAKGDVVYYQNNIWVCRQYINTPQFNPLHWYVTNISLLSDLTNSAFGYYKQGYRYMKKTSGGRTYVELSDASSSGYRAACACVPCKKGDVFYYTGKSHYIATSASLWYYCETDDDGTILYPSPSSAEQGITYGNVLKTNMRIVITNPNTTQIRVNFCQSNHNYGENYQYGLTKEGVTNPNP